MAIPFMLTQAHTTVCSLKFWEIRHILAVSLFRGQKGHSVSNFPLEDLGPFFPSNPGMGLNVRNKRKNVIQITFITLEENPQIIKSSKYLIFPINSVSIP